MKDYPLYSAGDIDQHAEMWGIQGRKKRCSQSRRDQRAGDDLVVTRVPVVAIHGNERRPRRPRVPQPLLQTYRVACRICPGTFSITPRSISRSIWNLRPSGTAFEMQDYSDVFRKMVDRGEIRKFD